jgi:hypothetical protein
MQQRHNLKYSRFGCDWVDTLGLGAYVEACRHLQMTKQSWASLGNKKMRGGLAEQESQAHLQIVLLSNCLPHESGLN